MRNTYGTCQKCGKKCIIKLKKFSKETTMVISGKILSKVQAQRHGAFLCSSCNRKS